MSQILQVLSASFHEKLIINGVVSICLLLISWMNVNPAAHYYSEMSISFEILTISKQQIFGQFQILLVF